MAEALKPREGESETEFMERVIDDPAARQDAEREAMLCREYAAACGVRPELLSVAVMAASGAALKVVAMGTRPGEHRAKAFVAAMKLALSAAENSAGD